jgi:hypothetical protein
MSNQSLAPYSAEAGSSVLKSVIAGTAIGSVVVAATFIGYGLLYETYAARLIVPGMVIRSSGQQFGMLIVLAGFLGGAGGGAVGLGLHRKWFIGSLVALMASSGTAAIVHSMWRDSVDTYGHDYSDFMYPPLLVLSSVVLVAYAFVVASVAAVRIRQ